MSFWPWKRRSEVDRIASILDSMTFILLHTENATIRAAVGVLYGMIPREAKNGRLQDLELRISMLHRMVTEDLERQERRLHD